MRKMPLSVPNCSWPRSRKKYGSWQLVYTGSSMILLNWPGKAPSPSKTPDTTQISTSSWASKKKNTTPSSMLNSERRHTRLTLVLFGLFRWRGVGDSQNHDWESWGEQKVRQTVGHVLWLCKIDGGRVSHWRSLVLEIDQNKTSDAFRLLRTDGDQPQSWSERVGQSDQQLSKHSPQAVS